MLTDVNENGNDNINDNGKTNVDGNGNDNLTFVIRPHEGKD